MERVREKLDTVILSFNLPGRIPANQRSKNQGQGGGVEAVGI